MIISGQILVIIRNILDKSYREIENTHFMFSNLLQKIVAFMRKKWKNFVESNRQQTTIYMAQRRCDLLVG
jgi:hypothetical protein